MGAVMVSNAEGILHRCIHDTPIAIVDFETTGLVAGYDRVVEVSVVRIEPRQEPKLVFDTLVNPQRRVSATEIHGITDEDVANAPTFRDIAGDFINSLSGCVVAAYNVYFDIKFLASELQQSNVFHDPPHFCVMYLRPMLGLGPRCKLDEACRQHQIEFEAIHISAHDAQASAKLLKHYLNVAEQQGVRTYDDLQKLKKYKFNQSFGCDPFPECTKFNLGPYGRLCSRAEKPNEAIDPTRLAIREYWDTLRTVVADLKITPEELEFVASERKRLGLAKEQIRVLHARAFAAAIIQFIDDQWMDDREVKKLRNLRKCLSELGWAPGD